MLLGNMHKKIKDGERKKQQEKRLMKKLKQFPWITISFSFQQFISDKI